ncbi:hypothetical protein PspCFBP13509_14065 [Pseudomonas sp. CFBP13509]|nr:hypothetical protein PspCFBP13509_14065 [Pseudomonas sp. CFBP13509]
MTAAHGFKPAFGHTEPRRGTEWWGESLLVTFGLFPKVTRCKSGTLSGRYRSNGYVLGQTQRHGRPRGRHGTKPPHHKEISQPERQTRSPALATTPCSVNHR